MKEKTKSIFENNSEAAIESTKANATKVKLALKGGGPDPPLNHQLFWAQINKSPAFFGLNHHHQFYALFLMKTLSNRGLNHSFDEIWPNLG